jgi:hypothetical protein
MRIGFRDVPLCFHDQVRVLLRDWRAREVTRHVRFMQPIAPGLPADGPGAIGEVGIVILAATRQDADLIVVEPADAVSLTMLARWANDLDDEDPAPRPAAEPPKLSSRRRRRKADEPLELDREEFLKP